MGDIPALTENPIVARIGTLRKQTNGKQTINPSLALPKPRSRAFYNECCVNSHK